MGQYELAKAIQDHDGPATLDELVRATGLSKGSVDDQIRKLEKKGYIQKSECEPGYFLDMSDDELEELRPYTIQEMNDK